MSSDELELYRQLERKVQKKIDLFKQKYPRGFHYIPRGNQILGNKRFDEWQSYLVKAPPPSQYVPLQSHRSAPSQAAPPSTTRLPPSTQSRQQPTTTSSTQADPSASGGSLRPKGNTQDNSYLSFLLSTRAEDSNSSQKEHEEGRQAVSNGQSTGTTMSPENSRMAGKRLFENKISAKPAVKKPSVKKPAVKTTTDTNVVKNNNHTTGKITSNLSKVNNNNVAPKTNNNGTSHASQNGISSKQINNSSSKLVNNGSSSIPVNNDTLKPIINNASSKVFNNDFTTVGTKTAANEATTTKSYVKDPPSVVSTNSIKRPKNLEEINAILQKFYATRKEKKSFNMPTEADVILKKRNKGKEVATKRPAQKRPTIKSERTTKRIRKSKSADLEATDDLEVDSESALPASEMSMERIKKPFVVKLKIPPRSSEESGYAQEPSRQEKFSLSRIAGQASPPKDRKDSIVRSIKNDKYNDNKNNSRKEKEGVNTTGKSLKVSRRSKVSEDLEESTRDSESYVPRNVKRKIDDESSDSTSKPILKRSKKKCVADADVPIKKEESSVISIPTVSNTDGMQTKSVIIKTEKAVQGVQTVQTSFTEKISIGTQTIQADSKPAPTSNDKKPPPPSKPPSSTPDDKEAAEFHNTLYLYKMKQATDYKHRSESEKVPLRKISDYVEACLLYADAFYNQYEAQRLGYPCDKLVNLRKFFAAVYGMDILKNESELVGVLKYIHAVISNILCEGDRGQCLNKEREHFNEYVEKIKNGSSVEAQEALKKYTSYLDNMKKSLKQCTESLNEAYENLNTARKQLGNNTIDINDNLKNVKDLARERVEKWRQDKNIIFDVLSSHNR